MEMDMDMERSLYPSAMLVSTVFHNVTYFLRKNVVKSHPSWVHDKIEIKGQPLLLFSWDSYTWVNILNIIPLVSPNHFIIRNLRAWRSSYIHTWGPAFRFNSCIRECQKLENFFNVTFPFLQRSLFLRITSLISWLKSTLLMKNKCFGTTIYMKTQCLQTNETQHYGKGKCLRSRGE